MAFNDNAITFVGDEGQMKDIMFAMISQYKANAELLGENRIPKPDFSGLDSSSSISSIAETIRSQCFDPVYLFGLNPECLCSADQYDFSLPKKIEGTDLYSLELFIETTCGLLTEDFSCFCNESLPSGRYGITAAFRDEEYYSDVYVCMGNGLDGGEIVLPCDSDLDESGVFVDVDSICEEENIGELYSYGLKEAEARKGTPQGYALESICETFRYWFDL